jgi:hypothetical protein
MVTGLDKQTITMSMQFTATCDSGTTDARAY